MTDAVRDHIQRVLKASRDYRQAFISEAEKLEREGWRIVDGGGMGFIDDGEGGQVEIWETTDWRTGEVIASSKDGKTHDEVWDDPDRSERWYHRDCINEEAPPYVETPGVPSSLGVAIEDWVGALDTPADEIAEFIGWSVAEVEEYRRES